MNMNRECQECGKTYKFCTSCGDYHANRWDFRQLYCCLDCYEKSEKRRLLSLSEKNIEIEKVEDIIETKEEIKLDKKYKK